MSDWHEMRDWHEVGSLVRSTGGEWMVRPPQRCGNGHPLGLDCSVLNGPAAVR